MPLVFLHGLGQTRESWYQVLAGLETKETLCPSLPALLAGREARYDELYAGFSGFCESVPGPLDLCGLSLGAVLALHYGLEHPDRVKSLVLIAPQFSMPKLLLKLQSAIFRLMPDRMFEDTGFGKREFLQLTGSMAQLDFTDRLSAITCPVLILCGERDRANRKAAEELSRKLPQARLQLISGGEHEVNAQEPEVLTGLLKEFYQN